MEKTKSSYDSNYCNICFIAVVRNQNLQHLRVVLYTIRLISGPQAWWEIDFITLLEITSWEKLFLFCCFQDFLLSLAFENSTVMSEFCCNVRIWVLFGVCLTTRIFTTCISLNLGSLHPLLVQTFPIISLCLSFPH